jgi:TetR/AcrR family transcriptional repressor of mexJK operon
VNDVRGGPRRGRPPSPAKRAAVLAAATEEFLAEGYAGTTMDRVAERAGVSKQTVYGHFRDKDTLFRAVLAEVRDNARPASPPTEGRLLDPDDLPSSLVRTAEAVLVRILDPRVAALRRLVIGELGRRPELRDLWNADGPTQLLEALTAELGGLAAQGVLDVPDARRAARQLIGLWAHEGNDRSRFGVDPLSDGDRHDIAVDVADFFLRAHRPGSRSIRPARP